MKETQKMNIQAIQEAAKEIAAPEKTVDESTLQKTAAFYRSRFIHYGYDDREPYNMKIVSKYCANLYHGTAKKGLCLIGDTGRGKTFAFKIIKKLFDLRIYQAADLVEKWQMFGIDNRREFWKELDGYIYTDSSAPDYVKALWRDVCIDDIGSEPTLNDYGTKAEVLDIIIQKRTRQFEDTGAKTHMAINLTPEMIIERYGKRFESRLHQLCHVVELRGADRRKDGKK